MSGLLKGDLDVAQAMIYNEYAQVLEAKNPATGELYQPSDLNVVDFNDPSVGTAMLQDQIFASDKWLKTGNNADVATKFLQATFKGWIYCRDNPQKCVDIVLAKGSQLGASHQAWQMNEINAPDLAVAERHRPARQGALRPDDPRSPRPTRSSRPRRPPTRPGRTSPRRRSTRSARRSTPRARASRRGPSPSRRAATRSQSTRQRNGGPVREGRPFEFERSASARLPAAASIAGYAGHA